MTNPRYHYRRKDSANWRLKLQYPPALAKKLNMPHCVFDFSLGTPDVVEAQMRSREYVYDYLQHLWTWQVEQGRRSGHFVSAKRFEPGTEISHGGMRVRARRDGKLIDLIDPVTDEVAFTRVNENFRQVRPAGTAEEAQLLNDIKASLGADRTRKLSMDADPQQEAAAHTQRIIDAWDSKRSVSKSLRQLVTRIITRDLPAVTGKTLVEASHADAEALARHYLDVRKLSPRTTANYVKWLSIVVKVSAVHEFGIKDVFANCMPKIRNTEVVFNGEPETVAFSDAETAKIMAYRPNLPPDLDLLLMLCASMGIRPREALSINGEFERDGLRCIAVGTKVALTARRLPLPPIITERPDFPKRISKPLYAKAPLGDFDAMERFSKNYTERMGTRLRAAGIKVTRKKRFYSFRHRAIDKMEDPSIDPRLARAIVGHEGGHRDTHEAYGDGGFSMHAIADGMKRIWEDLV